jgi:S1-C subfamily serine protease
MAAPKDWSFPEELRPKQAEVRFDLAAALQSVVLLRAEVPEDAFTAEILGTQRVGNGVAIRTNGRLLILTIGYLVTEAESIWLTTHDGQTVAGHALAYDQVTGFGLVLPLGHVSVPTLERGSIAATNVGSKVIVIGHGGESHSLNATVVAKREFAGYWEYLLDNALFTAPPHPQWGGTALLDQDGLLIGVGSLLVQEAVSGESFDANMFVPIDLLEPILNDMVNVGRSTRAPRPWLGMYTTEMKDHVVIAGLMEDGPAYRAGLRSGDVVVEVAGQPIAKLSELFRTIWSTGPTGTIIPMTVSRGAKTSKVRIESADREDFLKKPVRH